MEKKDFMNWSIESAIKIALVFLVVIISFLIFKPFLFISVWGIIIAVAFFPIYKGLKDKFNMKSAYAASIISLILLLIIALLSYLLVDKIILNVEYLSEGIKTNTLTIPEAPDNVKEWPLVGSTIYNTWETARTNFDDMLLNSKSQLKEFVEGLIQIIGNLMGSVFISIFAIIIAGLFLNQADNAYSFSIKTMEKLVGGKAKMILDNSKSTIKSVVKGVIGVSIIQSVLVGLGFLALDIPGAALLTLIVFIFALIQVPPIIIILPIVVFVFSQESTRVAVIFTIYELVAGVSDNFLKPLLLGRGVAIPMLIILIGAIGGMLLMGVIGLFIGPVIFALNYQLVIDWVNNNKIENSNS